MKSQINNLASQRLVWLDALKGIGILLIMTCHAGLLPRVSIFLTAGYVSLFLLLLDLHINQSKHFLVK